ncbi:MAG: hypothetical protein NTY75_01445 [Candidatus Shapirobacteria bacterium]|nr:hypothetical protein [Candidatus Shapirobacteria bacterium]
MIKVIIFLVLIFGLGYFGFRYLTSGSPRDLGIKYTEADRVAAYTNNGVEGIAITPSQDNQSGIKYEGQKEIKTSFSSAEISALNNSVKWVNYPVSNIQIKINADGTGEASGVLNVRKILSWISFTHSIKEIEAKVDEYHIGFNPPFYLKGSVSVINNKVTLIPQTIEVGRITIPQNLVNENIKPITGFVEDRLNAIPNLHIRSLNLDGGKVNLDATYPEKEFTVQN